jgi:hypothetical protein
MGVFIVVAAMCYDHNRGRFMVVPGYGDYPPRVLDTHTGQFCDPMPQGIKLTVFPKCADLAKNWR